MGYANNFLDPTKCVPFVLSLSLFNLPSSPATELIVTPHVRWDAANGGHNGTRGMAVLVVRVSSSGGGW